MTTSTLKQRAFIRTTAFIKKNVVMLIAFAVALATVFIVPVDKEYLSYFDYKTLSCLFCVLAVVCALKNVNFFSLVAHKIVRVFKNAKACVLALVYVTFIGSMLIANDMALLTFLPLGYLVLTSTGKQKYMAFTFIMQNIAANLGGMLTPFGNPQNLYLYSTFNIDTLEFNAIMFPPFILSIALITACCFVFVKSERLDGFEESIKLPVARTIIYGALFVLSVLIVLRVVPYLIGLAVIAAAVAIMDIKALFKVDYPLLLTFVFFFIFAGNVSRIPAVSEVISGLLNKNVLLVGVGSCQIISNVPSAILLSRFTVDYKSLLLAVNIGGVGTIISSLASLITFREYLSKAPGEGGRYLLKFSAFNFSFLAILTAFCLLIA